MYRNVPFKRGDGNGEEGGMTRGENLEDSFAFRWSLRRNNYSASLTSGKQIFTTPKWEFPPKTPLNEIFF